jgi:hypothetical protein
MDIELSLRQLQVLRDPGVRFTDGVMARVGDTPMPQPQDGVVQLADARARRRSRRILFITVVAIGVAAAMPMLWQRDRAEQPVAQAAPSTAGAALLAVSSSDISTQSAAKEPGESPDPLDCLDPDVIRGIVLMGMNSQTFSVAADLPPELAGFKAPRQFAWVGSTERGLGGSTSQSTVTVVYRTDLSPDAARTAGVQALTAGGWNLHDENRSRSSNVFTSSNSVPNSETFCREGQPVGIAASALDGVTYVALSLSRDTGRVAGFNSVCNQPPSSARLGSELDMYMPTLALPRDPATGQPVAMRGGGWSNGAVKRSGNTSFTTKDAVGNVVQHFAGQLAEQGWRMDAAWIGTGTAGSTWTRMGNAGSALQGTLVLSAFEDGRFTAAFHVVQTQ